MADRPLNTLLRTFVHSDGTWARCNNCETHYWGLFRSDSYILAKAQKHMKTHAPKAQEAPARAPRAKAEKPRIGAVPGVDLGDARLDPNADCVHGKGLDDYCGDCARIAARAAEEANPNTRDLALIDQAMADLMDLDVAA